MNLNSKIKKKPTTSLLKKFKDDFRFVFAKSEEDKNKIYRLRRDIYCEELGYEDPADAFKKLEYDEHDQRSLHCLIEHKRSGKAAGCMRLVMPTPGKDMRDTRLPLQSYAGQSITHETFHPALLSKDEICEISRLAVPAIFRRRSASSEAEEISEKTPEKFTQDEKETFPIIVIGLFLATYALVGIANRRHVFAMMEPRLPRLLSMSGFNFTKVGENINFHGKRGTFYIDHHQAEKEIHEELLPLYKYIQDELESQIKVTVMRETNVHLS